MEMSQEMTCLALMDAPLPAENARHSKGVPFGELWRDGIIGYRIGSYSSLT
jgi:hypothetical protein